MGYVGFLSVLGSAFVIIYLICLCIRFFSRKDKSVDKSVLSLDEFVGKLSPYELSQKVSEFVSDKDKLNGVTKIHLRGMPLRNAGCFDNVCQLLSQSEAQSVNLSSVTSREYRYYNSFSTGSASGYASRPTIYFSSNQAKLASSLPQSCKELSLRNFNSEDFNTRTERQYIDLLDFIPKLQGKNIQILDISFNNNSPEKLGVKYWANIFKILPNTVHELKLNGNYIGKCIKEDRNSESDEYKECSATNVTKLHLSSMDVQNNSVLEIKAFLEHFFPNLQELKFSDDCGYEHSSYNAAENAKIIEELNTIYAEKKQGTREEIVNGSHGLVPSSSYLNGAGENYKSELPRSSGSIIELQPISTGASF